MQGSIVGPQLWNVLFGGIMCMEMLEDTFLVRYVDDVTAVMVAQDMEEAQSKLNQVVEVSLLMDGRSQTHNGC